MGHIWASYWVQYVVQNVMPPSFWTLVGIGLAQWHTHRKLNRHHAEMKEHVRKHTEGSQ
jgi:hypothetical protein